MAQFYAEIRGARGPASRLGHKTSGIDATIKSWEGEVCVYMWHDDTTGQDCVSITIGPHSDRVNVRVLAFGPIEEVRKQPKPKPPLTALAEALEAERNAA